MTSTAAIDDKTLLHLTSAEPIQSAFIRYGAAPVPSAQGLSINFDFYAYGGTGADGIAFSLLDGSTSPIRPGGLGGSLGYAPTISGALQPGIVGGYVGIGFDEFGNFSNASEGRTGGIGQTPDSIAVRGSVATNYAYLVGTPTLPTSLDNSGAGATLENSRRNAQIDITPTGLLSVKVDLNSDGDYVDAGENAIDNFNLVGVNGALPATFRFGFAASTGNSTNNHAIGNFKVTTANKTPIPGDFTTDLVLSGGNTVNPVLVGTVGDDQLIAGGTQDTLTGAKGSDRFVFSGATKAQALRLSTVKSVDVITDFSYGEGDRVQLDFNNNISSSERPKGLFNAGREKGKTLAQAAKSAYADKSLRKGVQGLKANEAVFFKWGSSTYLSVNDGKAEFSAANDLVVNVTGIQFRSGDLKRGTLAVKDYFI